MDFDDYHNSPFGCRGDIARFGLVFALTFLGALALLEHSNLFGRGRAKSRGGTVSKLSSTQQQGSTPSSRWGHRFDDDDDAAAGDDIVLVEQPPADYGTGEPRRVPKYHHHSHNKTSSLTPEQKSMGLEKWEDYEMEVASVLAGASSGWDIHSKTGGLPADNSAGADDMDAGDSNENENESESDGYTDHWVRYHDKSSNSYYFFHRETNITQWEKPLITEGVVLLGVAYGTGREFFIEGAVVEEIDVNNGDHDLSGEVRDRSEVITKEEDPASDNFDAQEVLNWYKSSYWRWNHPYRVAAGTEVRREMTTAQQRGTSRS